MTSVHDVLKGRLMLLQSENPDLTFEDDQMDTELGTRALIRVLDGDEVMALEFIEPEELWLEPDAADEYVETVEEGIQVTVIVPTEEKEEAMDILGSEGKVKVLGYDEIDASLRYTR
jgi:hypothetical protein